MIRSPIDGVVVNRNVDVGQTIAATLQSPVLFTVADLKSMRLLTEVNEGEIAGVSRGSKVSFQIESLGPRTFYGTVTDVRLQPYAEQANAVATSGTAGASGLTPMSTTAPAGTPVPLGTTTTSSQPGSSASSGRSGTTTGNTGSNTATSGTATSGTAATPATPANPSSASGSSPSSAPAPGAVTYTAVVDVPNVDGLLAPGGTAIVTMGGGSRQGVVRLPNNALSFRPSPAMLERTGQDDLAVNAGAAAEKVTGDRKARVSQVWRFENNKFVPVDVVTGLSDDRWTEMISGRVQPGDQLVTNATAR